MNKILLSLLLMVSTALANDLSHITEISQAKPIHGEIQTVKTLKGKVILFEYWGFN